MRIEKLTQTIAVALIAMACSAASAAQIGFEEDFALAPDRTVPLKTLITGTPEYYYYSCLQAQNAGQLDKADELIAEWVKRHNQTPQAIEMENRQALLRYATQPQKSLDYITQHLGIQFSDQPQTAAQQQQLPTALDPTVIDRDSYTRQALSIDNDTIQGFEPAALDWLITTKLTDAQLRELLGRLDRPDHANLPALIARDLASKYGGGGFGSVGIHNKLLLGQLDDLAKLRPEMLNDNNFIYTYMARLWPNSDVDWQHDAKEHTAYLDRLWNFVSQLAPGQNSLKADVLYQRLVFDRTQGVWDKDRFIAYLKLPRNAFYVNPLYTRDSEVLRDNPIDFNANFSSQIFLPPINNDEPVLRSYLMHFLADADNGDDFAPYIETSYLKQVFAEAKIVNGVGDQDKWYAMLSPEQYQALKDRIDIDFAYTNPNLYAPDDKVSLDLFVKNVKTLIVKVYEINTTSYYKTNLREIDTDINLDGLVANQENVYTYDDAPLRRVARHFDFPNLNGRGVYVVEFIGNGQSSRALIRKGKLRYTQRAGSAGQVFEVLDEGNHTVPEASIWLSGRQFKAEGDDHTITIPFSTAPGNTQIILQNGDFASLDRFDHAGESYSLVAGMHVDRESLIKGGLAKVIVRPALYVDGIPVAIKLLEEARLTITSVDRDGVSTSKEIPDFSLMEEQSTVTRFAVPDRLAGITFTLQGKVQNLSQNKKDDLSVSQTFAVNGIDATEKTQDLFLSHADGIYYVDVLGKTGETRPDQAVQFSFKHRDFTQEMPDTLKSDAQGRIKLGALDGITRFTATDPQGTAHTWTLEKDVATISPVMQIAAGGVVRIPYMGSAKAASRDELSLLVLRGHDGTNSDFVADRFDSMTIQDGYVVIAGLPAGDYSFEYKPTQQYVTIRVTAGEEHNGWALGANRLLQLGDNDPLQIVSVQADEKNLRIQLANANALTRVHLIATHFVPEYSLYGDLAAVTWPTPGMIGIPAFDSYYVSGRNLGDEYRYIIDRKYATKFPGNMLTRPGLLLNPWSIAKTQTALEQLAAKSDFGGVAGESGSAVANGPVAAQQQVIPEASHFSNLDFLADKGITIQNLVPDAKGVIEIPRTSLGSRQQIHVVAVDPASTVYREFALPAGPLPTRDLRLANALDPAKHFTEQRQISIAHSGETLTFNDSNVENMEIYDTIAKAYKLYSTLHPDPTLAEFSFIAHWPDLKPDEKRTKYSKYACHELNYFLYRKDPDFFKAVVAPYLKNKKDKTFMDHYLVGDDLSGYESPWAYGQLNTVEKILLAERIAGEQARTARHIKDHFDLLPPNVEQWTMLFDTALKGGALERASQQVFAANTSGNFGTDGTSANWGLTLPAGTPAPSAAPPSAESAAAQAALSDDATKETDKAINENGGLRILNGNTYAGGTTVTSGALSLGSTNAITVSGSGALTMNGATATFGALRSDGDLKKRGELHRFYQALDKTEEWAENNYYHLPIAVQNADLVPVNAFWNDYAAADRKAEFLSTHLPDPCGNFTQIMFALSVTDLPFDAGKVVTASKDGNTTISSSAPLIVFHKEIREAAAGVKTPILISQNYFRNDDRYAYNGNEQSDKFVTEEFLTHVVYGCQVVITNPTSGPQKLDVLLQIPKGAIPVLMGQYTRGQHIELAPYQTQPIEYRFYFPTAGQYAHYPVQVAKNEKVIGSAEPFTMKVVDKLSKIDTTSWEYISQNGTLDQVLDYLKNNNIDRLNLDSIAWRMQDKASYAQILAVLTDRHVFNLHLWMYALKHNDLPGIREYLQHNDAFANQCGAYLDSKPLTIDPVIRKSYQHLEYNPLVNARAHGVGRQRQILNDRFFGQYEAFLTVMRYRPTLDNDDLMSITYYLLLQDRIDEAKGFFARVDAKQLATTLQYDYFAAYLDFYTPTHAVARDIAAKYADYPIDRWRNLFAQVTAQLDEIEGKGAKVIDKEDRNQQMANLAAAEPTFDFKVEDRKIQLTYQNLPEVQINYYLMDIELMFSQNPFIQEFGGQFSSIKPNDTAVVKLDAAKPAVTIDLPDKFHNSNVMVEIVGEGKTVSKVSFANSMTVTLDENYGQIKVTSEKTGAPLSVVYVKTYARMKDGSIAFYKDGYTDLRGKFDYTSLNTTEINNVDKFSILILSDTDGAVVKEAAPPKQ